MIPNLFFPTEMRCFILVNMAQLAKIKCSVFIMLLGLPVPVNYVIQQVITSSGKKH